MPKSKRLETDRLILRTLTDDDRADFLAYYVDEDAAALRSGNPQVDEAIAQAAFRRQRLSPYFWAIERKDTGRVIGDVHLGDIVNMYLAHVGYSLHCDARGMGYAREAVSTVVRWTMEETGIGRIRAMVLTHNAPSIRLLEACGFQREAMLRDGNYGGRVADVYYYSIGKYDIIGNHRRNASQS